MSEARKALAEVRGWLCDNLDASDAGHVCGMLSVVSRRVVQADELESENARLQEKLQRRTKQYEIVIDMWVGRVAENSRLRELVRDMWRFMGAACKKYPRLFGPAAQGGQMVQLNAIDDFEQRMRDLEVEVDE